MIGNKAKIIFLFCVLVFIDQISKFIVINHFKNGLFFLRGFLGLEVCKNYGFAFGVELGNIGVIILTIGVLGLFLYVFRSFFSCYCECHPELAKDPVGNNSKRRDPSLPQNDRRECSVSRRGNLLPFILILAGATSNLLDRVFRGYIIDFIHFSPFWILNLSDIFILTGLLLLFFQKNKFQM